MQRVRPPTTISSRAAASVRACECVLHEWKTAFIALAQRVRVRPREIHLEISLFDQSCGLAGKSGRRADSLDIAHVCLPVPPGQNVECLADHRVDTSVSEIVGRIVGVLDDVVEHGGVHGRERRVASERLRHLDTVGDEEQPRTITPLSECSGSDRYRISEIHGLTLFRLGCGDTPERVML